MRPATIWKEKLRHLVSAIQNNATSHREVQNASRLIQTDHHERFAVELLQNANDQAVRAAPSPEAVEPTSVRILWRENRVAVLNQGRAFDERGMRAITSLALSDKTQAELIGNKGVGFKAVYEVADEPRIYSGTLRFSVPTRFADEHLERLRVTAHEVLSEPESARLAERDDALDMLVAELLASPPFYYPRPLGEVDLEQDLDALGIDDFADFATLIVLPLRQGAGTKVEQAFERLLSPGTLLFLPGVDDLGIEWNGRRSALSRRPLDDLAPGIETIEVTVDGSRSTWWRTRGEVRNAALVEAARRLELESWKSIDHAPIAIALPVPDDEGRPLGAEGRFCLGLPTDQSTGLPLWVDGRFHGKLNREGLDLDTDYNAEVLAGVRTLFTELLDHLRNAKDVRLRRAATLALEPGDGALAAHPDWGDATVLCADHEFRPPDQVWVPKERVFERPGGGSTTMPFDLLCKFRRDAHRLPERALLEHGGGLLAGLGVEPADDDDWLDRAEEGALSPLEAGAKQLREECGDWQVLLEWVVHTFPPSDLHEQVFLPVVGGLASPASRVYLPDRARTESLHPLVSQRLLFLDDDVLTLRDATGLTDIAEELTRKDRLVRSPRLYELLKQALVPAMEDANERTRWQLLSLAVQWLGRLKQDGRTKASDLPLLLPTNGGWQVAQRCYLGSGWGERDRWHEDRLEGAYSTQRLVPWNDVATRLGDVDQERWFEAMEILDVPDLPRLEPLDIAGTPFDGWGERLHRRRSFESGLTGVVAELFDEYLDWVAENVPSGWSHSRTHSFRAIHWIDGLDVPGARQLIAEMVLANPSGYPLNTWVFHAERARSAPSFWLFVLRGGLTYDGCQPDQVWLIPEGEADRRWTRLVDSVSSRLAQSPALLRELGVYAIDTAPTRRLVAALHQLAAMLDARPSLSRDQRALSLAVELWTRLSRRLESGDQAGLTHLGTQALPLHERFNLVARVLEEEVFILIEDDKERARWLHDEVGRHTLPFRRDPPKHFVDRLQRALGTKRVRRASEHDVDPGFRPSGASKPILDVLRDENPGDIELELAAVLTFALPGPTLKVPAEPYADLAGVQVKYGGFEGNETGFYDRRSSTLMVRRGTPALAEIWRVVGEASRHVLGAFERARRQGDAEAFLAHENIGPAELNELEEEMGRAGYGAHAPLFVVARWVRFRDEAGESLSGVARSWHHPRRGEEICQWLGVTESPPWTEALLRDGEPEGTLGALASIGGTVDEWQEARELLGKARFAFPETLLRWKSERADLVARIRAEVARDWATDLESRQADLSKLAGVSCPDEVKYARPCKASVLSALRNAANDLGLPVRARTKGWEHYRDFGDAERARDAESAVRLRLQEAKAACPDQDDQAVWADARLSTLTANGPWAHWRLALQRLSAVLRDAGWPCHADMQRRNAFINRPKAPPPPEPEPDPETDQAGEDDEQVGDPEPVDSPDPTGPRDRPPGRDDPEGETKKRGGGGGGGRGSDRQRQKTGDRGEKFFFDALRSWYREQQMDFDETCWVSSARQQYGFPEGDDSLGYDFRARDPGRPDGRGRLSVPVALCHVEVKTTASGGTSFPMTAREWSEAQACAQNGHAIYVLVRVDLSGGTPAIADVIPDPVAAKARGELLVSPKDHWVTLGRRRGREGEERPETTKDAASG